ncbi:uncharacterized protein LODBEIA_P35600 [Lodderomyces beijingensis]|uniref:Uncharacterized protein n=1 Tax=Lodderomyces beijingensis TaxID=1775926 RepID=A0ABP0ZQF4_9ASCO
MNQPKRGMTQMENHTAQSESSLSKVESESAEANLVPDLDFDLEKQQLRGDVEEVYKVERSNDANNVVYLFRLILVIAVVVVYLYVTRFGA